jgi:hypothetical protein
MRAEVRTKTNGYPKIATGSGYHRKRAMYILRKFLLLGIQLHPQTTPFRKMSKVLKREGLSVEAA